MEDTPEQIEKDVDDLKINTLMNRLVSSWVYCRYNSNPVIRGFEFVDSGYQEFGRLEFGRFKMLCTGDIITVTFQTATMSTSDWVYSSYNGKKYEMMRHSGSGRFF